MTRDIVLVGGGHTHVHVLKSVGLKPIPGVRLTVVARDVETAYSGMLPGFIAGHYTREQCHIDLGPLSRFAGARLIHGEAVGLDLAGRKVICRGHPAVAYDIVSIDIGSTPHLDRVPGAAEHATPIKPITGLAARWETILAHIVDAREPVRFLTVGGGAAGVEVTLAMQHRLRHLLAGHGRDPDSVSFTLVTRGKVLAGHNASARRRFMNVLKARRVTVVEHSAVESVRAGVALCADGRELVFDELIWVTEAGAASWLRETGLALDEDGFIEIDATLRSLNDPHVFAAGDVASNFVHPRAKAGVFAVRQGPPLADNLRHAIVGEPLQPFHPQHAFLSLISTGDKYVIASRGRLAAQGALLWHLKDWIDRRWMHQYQQLPERAALPR